MPRSSEKSMVRAEFEEAIEDVCTIIALEAQSREDSDKEMSGEDSEFEDVGNGRSDWKVVKDLVDIYDIFLEPRYMITSCESAGRHEDDVLGNLIYMFPESAFLALFRMKRASFWALVELVIPLWNEHRFGSRIPVLVEEEIVDFQSYIKSSPR